MRSAIRNGDLNLQYHAELQSVGVPQPFWPSVFALYDDLVAAPVLPTAPPSTQSDSNTASSFAQLDGKPISNVVIASVTAGAGAFLCLAAAVLYYLRTNIVKKSAEAMAIQNDDIEHNFEYDSAERELASISQPLRSLNAKNHHESDGKSEFPPQTSGADLTL
jgi:hypothetical protein